MAKGTGQTVYLVGLVFAILTSMGILVVAYTLNQDLTEAERKIVTAEDKLKVEVDRVKVIYKELQECRLLIHGRENDEVKYDHFKTTILDPASTKIPEILALEYAANDDWKNIQDAQVKQLWQKLVDFKQKPRQYTNFAELFAEIYDQMTALIHVLPRLRSERISAREEVETIRQNMVRDLQTRQREIDELRTEKNSLQDQNIELGRRFDLEKKRLQEEKDNILKERARLERDFRLEEARLQSTVSQLENRIEDLTKKQNKSFAEFSTNDGEVVFSDAALGYTWIDIGRRHGLRRNTRFQVYQFVKGGLQKIKGVIEVRRVEEDMAQCAIIENAEVIHPITGDRLIVPDANDPIVKGDMIRNPFFDAGEQRDFVFIGTKLENRYYNLQELQRKVEEFGGKVDRDVSIGTDFVVVLGEAEEDADLQEKIRRASQFGVIFMREEEMLEYLGR
jgi:NAD-dependent DNA ligase